MSCTDINKISYNSDRLSQTLGYPPNNNNNNVIIIFLLVNTRVRKKLKKLRKNGKAKRAQADSLTGLGVSTAIGWKLYRLHKSTYLACLRDAANFATKPRPCTVSRWTDDCHIPGQRPATFERDKCKTIRSLAVLTQQTGWLLDNPCDCKGLSNEIIQRVMSGRSPRSLFTNEAVQTVCVNQCTTTAGMRGKKRRSRDVK